MYLIKVYPLLFQLYLHIEITICIDIRYFYIQYHIFVIRLFIDNITNKVFIKQSGKRKFTSDTSQINWQDFMKKTIKQSIVDEIY